MTVVHEQPAWPVPVAPTRLTLLDTEHWLCAVRGGRRVGIPVDQLDPQHRRNVLAWLRARAKQMADWQDQADYRLYLDGLLGPDEYMARQRERRAVPAEVWLEDTPLVRRLVTLTTADKAPHPPRRRRFLPARLRGRR